MESRFDELLHTVIAEKGEGIHGFFDEIFSFLYRKTDFFYEMAPGEKMGFFPGQAQGLLLAFYRKYQETHFKNRVPKREIDQEEVKKFIEEHNEKKKVAQSEKKVEEKEKIEEKPKEEPKEKKKPEVHEEISNYNGDITDQYTWSQNVYEVNIQLKLPEAMTKKQIEVAITRTKLKITFKKTKEVFFEAEFGEKVKAEDSFWSLDGPSLVFFLEKEGELIWKQAFKGHKEIDTKTVDNSKSIQEFDNDTQAALNKIMYEQNRKRNGLPTTEEEKKIEALKEAWSKPDSPFKDQPFDPSQFNLNEPIYYNTPDYEASLKEKAKREQENTN